MNERSPEEAMAREITAEIREAYKELQTTGKSLPKELPKAICTRLRPLGYLTMAGAREIFTDFGSPIDIVAWKATRAQAAAIVIEHGFADDRVLQLDEFNPQMRLQKAPLVKIYVDVNAPAGLRPPINHTDAFVFGLSTSSNVAALATPRTNLLEDQPF